MPQVNKTLITEKCDTILRCVQRIRDKSPLTQEALERDLDAQDIIAINLERAVQCAVDVAVHFIAYTPLPAAATMAEAFTSLEKSQIISGNTAERMRKAVGLRNIFVHEYKKVDWSIVWQVIQNHLSDFVAFVNESIP